LSGAWAGWDPARHSGHLREAIAEIGILVGTAGTANGVYVHDRRGGERVEVVNLASRPLARHESDELYGIALGAGLDADMTLVTGCQPPDLIDADLYRRPDPLRWPPEDR
jgi:1-phosphofructokinase